MRFLITLVTLTLLAAACQDIRYPKKPKDLIPEDQMAEVLVDIHLFNEAKILNKRLLEESGLDPYGYIFEKYGIDSARFESSQAYYTAHIKRYARIYERVQERLEEVKIENEN